MLPTRHQKFLSSPALVLATVSLLVLMLSAAWTPAADAAGTTIKVTSLDPDTGGPLCKIRDAVTAANTSAVVGGCDGSGGGPFTIELANRTYYQLTQLDNNGDQGDNGLPQITTDITINANGSAIQRSPTISDVEIRLFQVNAGAVLRLNNAKVQYGHTDQGGAFYIKGEVVLNNTNVSANSAHCGGAILVQESGKLSLTNTTFAYNEAFE
jgi:hypothetical protein